MKVVLSQDVKNVGKEGEIKEVADGFARNFLLPNSLAEVASDDNVAKAEKKKEEKVEEEKAGLKENQNLANELDGREVLVKKKAEDGKLFGSVSAKDISESLAAQGVRLAEEKINLDEPIKELGEHQVGAILDHGIEAEIKVVVEAE